MEPTITRRRCLALGAAAAAHLCRGLVAGPKRRPNFVFILSDDQGWSGLSVAMHDGIPGSKSDFHRTPNLERLARQGMRFSAAYAPSPVCSPTRISLLTGKSPAQLHWTKAAPVRTAADGCKLIPPVIVRQIADRETTIGEALKRAGYATAHFGKWHLRGGGPGRHGFDAHDGDTGNKDAAPFKDPNPVDIFGISKRANAFMEASVKAGKPFYVQLSHHALHYPEHSLKATQEACARRRPRANPRETAVAAMTENLDTGVGVVLDAIDRLGIADSTYVLYMSDNGAGGGRGRGPLRGGKGSVWEGGIRVPLIIRGPGVEAGACCHARVVGYDLFPTFCELAGVIGPLPKGIEGGSIVPLFGDGKGVVKRPREELGFHFPHYQGPDGPHSALLLGDHKLIRFYETGATELYDLKKDVGERRDLAPVMAHRAKALGRQLDQYLRSVSAQMPTPNPQYDPARLPVPRRRRPRKRDRRRPRHPDGTRQERRDRAAEPKP